MPHHKHALLKAHLPVKLVVVSPRLDHFGNNTCLNGFLFIDVQPQPSVRLYPCSVQVLSKPSGVSSKLVGCMQ